jgi:hypothetical protein
VALLRLPDVKPTSGIGCKSKDLAVYLLGLLYFSSLARLFTDMGMILGSSAHGERMVGRLRAWGTDVRNLGFRFG